MVVGSVGQLLRACRELEGRGAQCLAQKLGKVGYGLEHTIMHIADQ
jgi:hypothetical protein